MVYDGRHKMRKVGVSFLILVVGMGLVSSEVPSASEYERAKDAITALIENNQDLPRTVRLGRIH